MNILLVHNHYQQRGGEDIVVENEKRMLEKHGNNVFLYEKDNNDINNYNFIKKILMPFNYIFNIQVYMDIKKIIKDNKINIVHVHNTINIISSSVFYASFKMKIPVVQTLHNFRLICPNGLLYRDGKICEDCLNKGLSCAIKHKCYRNNRTQTLLSVINLKLQRKLNLYNKVNYICLTDFNKKKLLKNSQIKENKVFIKPNFAIVKSKIKFTKKRNNRIILACRLEEYKGIKFIFKVWKERIFDIELYVYGKGPLEDWCKKYIEENNISNIKMCDFVKNDQLIQELAISKAVIMSSNLHEAFPMNIVESLSVGTPIITSDLGNAGNLIQNGKNGYKYKHNSINSCVNAIRKTINDEKLYRSCLEFYRNNLSEEINYKLLISIYQEIIMLQ